MTTTISISFTADAGGFDLDGSRFFGAPAEHVSEDFKRREPVAYAAAHEFVSLGTTSGTVTITAV